MEDKVLNEKESLELISLMIRNTQSRIEAGSGRYFLIWGYVTVLIALAVWGMITVTGDLYWHLLWYGIPVLGFIFSFVFGRKQIPGVKTYMDRIVNSVWIVCGIAGLLSSCLTPFVAGFPILYVIVLLMGVGTTLTGLIVRFKPAVIGGIAGICLQTVLSLLLPANSQILVFAVVFILMMIIPGHILNSQFKTQS